MQKSKVHIGDIVGTLVILFVVYCVISQLYTNINKSSNQSNLQKYYNTHPDQYKKDMNDQKYIQDLKKEVQNKLDEQKLNQ